MMSMSSANASRSPLFLMLCSILEEFSASSRYILKSTGDRTEPYGSPISALSDEEPTSMVEFSCSFIINSTNANSAGVLHLFYISLNRSLLSTESYAFCKSMRRLYFLLFFPYNSLRSLLMWMAVDLPSLKPVWYIFESIR
jgi:hypothetical protein